MGNFVYLLTKILPDVLSKLVIPLSLTILTGIISDIRLHYLNLQRKNKYLNLLIINYPSIEAVINTIKEFKKISQVYSFYSFFLGLFLSELCYLLFIYAFFSSDYFPGVFDKYTSLINITDVGKLCYLFLYFVFVPVLITSVVYLVFYELIKSRRSLIKDNNDLYKLTGPQILSYCLFCFSIGFIFGPCVLGIIIFYLMATYPYFSYSSSLTSNDKFVLSFTIIISLLVMFLSLNILFDILKKIKRFSKNVIDPIINYHQYYFPTLIIKTDSGEFKGQLKDFQNKYLVTLLEENILHFVSWNKIETMEVININKSECIVHSELKKKNLSI